MIARRRWTTPCRHAPRRTAHSVPVIERPATLIAPLTHRTFPARPSEPYRDEPTSLQPVTAPRVKRAVIQACLLTLRPSRRPASSFHEQCPARFRHSPRRSKGAAFQNPSSWPRASLLSGSCISLGKPVSSTSHDGVSPLSHTLLISGQKPRIRHAA